MINSFKKSFVFFSFLLILGGITIWGESVEWKRSQALKNEAEDESQSYDQESYFETVSFYRVKNEKPVLHLDAKELSMNSATGKSLFAEPEGVAFTGNGEPVQYSARNGFLFRAQDQVIFENEVKFKMETSTLSADKTTYFMNIDEIVSEGNVETISISEKNKTKENIKVWSNSAITWPSKDKSRYEGDVRGVIKRKRVYEESVSFKAQQVDVNMLTLQIDLLEKVHLEKQQLKADSHRGEIFLENYNKKLKYFVLYDDVKVVEKVKLEKDGRVSSFERRAFGEKLEGMMSESKIILTGYPKVFQQNDVITGNKIVLRENNEVVEVDDANTNFILR
ncbi:putative membrane protein [Halobacteriovorax marinus SJ]|uniref:Membrane protein n=1 Tax=Halobacteriovorax marinus (strain ATCC BAA-682 / DSM 15412 / SJ) TaxID=862908 RepID=E1WXD8_HALMS|nr:LPS export ABC transporter periplasmic protein LptC [Halobacteriovorax marinus]CBW27455.1 putative membrane protein [Halobacteriovorax marinus SJ]